MNYSIAFRAANVIVAAFMIIGGVMTIIAGGFPNFIQGIFVIIFGVATMLFEFRLPAIIIQFASFMFSFMGRGLFYIFIGCITLSYGALALASGIIITICGVAYIGLHFFRGIDAPSNMQMTTFEETLGYSTTNNTTSYVQSDYPQPSTQPTYPTSNFANAAEV